MSQELRLSRPEAREMGTALLRQDRPLAAHAVALGLLRADPRDFTALMILARAEAQLGRFDKSQLAARRAWRAAQSDDERFAAAYTMSQALSAQERYGAAQWWLRRAGQASDKPGLERAAAAQFKRVRAANPTTRRLSFSIKPSSNINGGPTSNTLTVGGITFVNPAAVPLSGVEYSTAFTLRHQLTMATPDGGPGVHLGVSVDDRRYSLSSEAKRKVPSAKSSDYAFTEVEVFGGLTFPDASGKARTTVDLTIGHTWYGHDPLSEYARLDLGRDWALGAGRLTGIEVSYEDQRRHDNSARSSETLGLSGYWRMPVADKGDLTLSMAVEDVTSESSAIAHASFLAGVSFAPTFEVWGTESLFSLTFVGREYDRPRYGPSARSDRKLVAGAEFTFSKLEYLEFAPTLGINYARTQSNVSLFDSREVGLSLGVRSTF
jgi:hypothetical protein